MTAVCLFLQVRCLYRPENTEYSWDFVTRQDVNLLYWTDHQHEVDAESIEGKCYVVPENKITEEHPFLWTRKGNYRFYYSEAYNIFRREVEPLPEYAQEYKSPSPIVDYPMIKEPLAMMDVFAGCGGLSIGLEQSGVAKVLKLFVYIF